MHALKGSWFLNSTGPAEAEAVSGEVIDVTIPFNASSREILAYVLDENCTNPFDSEALDPNNMYQFEIYEFFSNPQHFIQYNMTTGFDITKIRDAENSIWDGSNTSGTFKYCLRQDMVLALDGKYEIVNFLENVVTVTVNLDASFEIENVKATRDEATKEEVKVDYSDYVTAYECVNGDLEEPAANQEYSQGDDLKICVTSVDSDIVTVEKIKSLKLSQEGDNAGAPFDYIANGSVESDELAATNCDPTSKVCWADMQLLGRYFAVENPGSLTATGSVELSFGSSSRRLTVDVPVAGVRGGDLALDSNSARRIEENPQPEPFDVRVSLTSVVESGGDYYGVSLVSGLVAAVGGAILMV